MRADHAGLLRVAGRAEDHVVPVGLRGVTVTRNGCWLAVGKETVQLFLFKMSVEKEPPRLNLNPLAHHGLPNPQRLCHCRLPGPTRQGLGRSTRSGGHRRPAPEL